MDAEQVVDKILADAKAEAEKIVTYANFTPQMMDAYIAAAAYDTPEGDIELFCPGLAESTVYRNNPPSGVFLAAAKAEARTLIFSSDPDLVDGGHVWAPPVLADLAERMPNGEYRPMPGCGHLMVQENPQACVDAILEHALGTT